MKNILLFSLLLIIIPFIIISTLVINNQTKDFVFTKNTTVRIYRTKTKKIDVVPLEEYIIGVVAGEMPASFKKEALKAQAVAARSYVMYKIVNNKKSNYDVTDTTLNQVYLDDSTLKKNWKNKYEENKKKIESAVEETAYEYITYNGKIADALFFSTSSGYTENSEDVFVSALPYLKSVESKWDNISPSYIINKNYNKDDFCKKLQITCTNKINIEITDKTKSGRINKLKINNKEFTGKEIVNIFSLKSVKFEIKVTDKVVITTRGFGHGVGMSQYGAEGMARAGYTYDQILKYYYTGVKIEKIKN